MISLMSWERTRGVSEAVDPMDTSRADVGFARSFYSAITPDSMRTVAYKHWPCWPFWRRSELPWAPLRCEELGRNKCRRLQQTVLAWVARREVTQGRPAGRGIMFPSETRRERQAG